MRIEKTISFRAEDNGTSQVVNRLRKEAEDYRDTMVDTALKSSSSSKEFIRALEEEIRILEKRRCLVKQINTESINQKYDDSINDNNQRLEELKRRNRRGDARVSDFDVEEERKKIERDNRSLNSERRTEINRANLEDDIQIKLLRELIENVKSTADEQIKEYRKNTEDIINSDNGTIINGGGGGGGGRANNGNDGNNRGGSRDNDSNTSGRGRVLGALIINDIIREVVSTLNNFTRAQNGDMAFNEMFSAIPLLGSSISTALGRHLEQRQARDISQNLLSGTTGSGGLFGFNNLGLDQVEGTNLATQIARARGYRGDIGRGVLDLYSTSRAFNIDTSALMTAESNRLYTGRGALESTSGLLSALRSAGTMGEDTSRLAKLLEIQNELTSQQLQLTEKVDSERISQVIGAFSMLGGRYTDPNRAGQAISSISNSLRNPSNDYQQAQNFAVLSRLNANATYFQMLEMQEQGVYQPGFLKEYLRFNEEITGGGESAMMNLYLRFKDSGMSAAQARYLVENGGRFNDEYNIDQVISKSDILSRGTQNVTGIEQRTARVNDLFAESAVAGVQEVIRQAFSAGALELKSALSSDFFKMSGEQIGDAIIETLGASDLKKRFQDWAGINPSTNNTKNGVNETRK